MERRALISHARIRLGLLLLGSALAGCYASHGRTGAREDAGASPMTCEAANVDLRVRAELRVGPEGRGCEVEEVFGNMRGVAAVGGALEITLDTCLGCEARNACVIVIEGLHPDLPAAAAADLSARRLFDVWFEGGPAFANLRDTSRCDGPAPPECPILFRGGQGELSGFEDPLFDFAWDSPVCPLGDGPCAESVHELVVNGVEPIAVRRVGQGQTAFLDSRGERDLTIANSASTRSPCTDEPPLAEWAAWLRAP